MSHRVLTASATAYPSITPPVTESNRAYLASLVLRGRASKTQPEPPNAQIIRGEFRGGRSNGDDGTSSSAHASNAHCECNEMIIKALTGWKLWPMTQTAKVRMNG